MKITLEFGSYNEMIAFCIENIEKLNVNPAPSIKEVELAPKQAPQEAQIVSEGDKTTKKSKAPTEAKLTTPKSEGTPTEELNKLAEDKVKEGVDKGIAQEISTEEIGLEDIRMLQREIISYGEDGRSFIKAALGKFGISSMPMLEQKDYLHYFNDLKSFNKIKSA